VEAQKNNTPSRRGRDERLSAPRYASFLNGIGLDPESKVQSPKRAPLAEYTETLFLRMGRKSWPLLFQLESESLNLDVLANAIGRLVLWKLRPYGRNRRRNLETTLGSLKEAHKRLDPGGLGLSPHFQTLQHLRKSCELIESELVTWTTKSKSRGPTPETRIVVALLAYVREKTKKPHWNDLAKLISRAYEAENIAKCTVGQLKQLWKSHRSLRQQWQVVLGVKSPQKVSPFDAFAAKRKPTFRI
jgi:hypothetical protein